MTPRLPFRWLGRSLHVSGRTLSESYLALLLSTATGVAAGILLGKVEQTLLLLPGLVVLVPAAVSMRGNIYSALGSRLNTQLHLGTINSFTTQPGDTG